MESADHRCYIEQVRIEAAKGLLHGGATVSRVAQLTGFGSAETPAPRLHQPGRAEPVGLRTLDSLVTGRSGRICGLPDAARTAPTATRCASVCTMKQPPVQATEPATTEAHDRNRHIVATAFDRWRDGMGTITDLFAPDMVWRIEGHSFASREYSTAQAFVDEVLTPFGARFSAGEPFRPVRIRSVLADADAVVVIWDGHGVANDGKPYDNSYAWIMQLRDGKVVDGTAFYDSISFNDLWQRVRPHASSPSIPGSIL
jgi:ketosteroid isomerase-like protein